MRTTNTKRVLTHVVYCVGIRKLCYGKEDRGSIVWGTNRFESFPAGKEFHIRKIRLKANFVCNTPLANRPQTDMLDEKDLFYVGIHYSYEQVP